MEKMTYVKALEIAIASVADAEVKEKLEGAQGKHCQKE